MRRTVLGVGLGIGLTATAWGQSTWTDFCGSSEWFATCSLANACGQNQAGCSNNWHYDYGCGVQCPLGFPGAADAVVIPVGPTISLTAGSASIYSLDSSRYFILGGGLTLNQSAIFRVGLDWVNGLISGGAPSGTVTIPSNTSLLLETVNTKSLSSRTLVLDGPAYWQDTGTFGLSNAATVENNSLFDARGDAALVFFGGGSCMFRNSGTFRKSAGTGITSINLPFDSSGPIEVQTGTLRLSATGTATGPITLAAGAVMDFINGNYTFDSGAEVSGPGLLNLNGLLTVAGPVPVDHASLTGQLLGAGDLEVRRTLDWSNGLLAGIGTATIDPNAMLTMYSGNTKSLSQRTLHNIGTALWQDSGTLGLSNGGVITNDGLLEATGDAALVFFGGAACLVTNNGTFRKNGGTQITSINNAMFNSSGPIDVRTGTLRLSTAGTATGPITLAAGTALDFINGSYTFDSGASITGAGVMNMNGTLTVLGPVSVDNATQTGTLAGAGVVTIAKTLDWSNGTMFGTGSTVISPQATAALESANTKSLSQRAFDNQGVTTWQDSGTIALSSGATITNAGTLLATGDAGMTFFGGGATTFTNTGTFRKNGASGLTSINGVVLNSAGIIDVQTGTLRLSTTGTASGPISLAANTSLDTVNGAYTLAGGANVTGAGLLNDNGTLTINDTINVDHAALSGTLTTAGVLAIKQTLDWSNGTKFGAGSLVIDPNATLTLFSGNTKSGAQGTLVNQGLTRWQDGGTIGVSNGFNFNNNGMFQAEGDAGLTYFGGATSTFSNSGVVRKSGGAGVTTINGMVFNSSGAIEVQSGTLRLSTTGTMTGSATLAAGTALDVLNGSYTFGSGAAVTGAGLFTVNGTLTVSNSADVDHAALTNVLNGPGTLTISKSLDWTNGLMQNGTTVIQPGATLTITSGNTKSLSAHALQNNGVGVWQDGGTLNVASGATFTNAGSLALQSDTGVYFVGGAPCTFVNSGTLVKAPTTGTSTISPSIFTNTGTVDIQSGTLSVANFTQSAGVTRVSSNTMLTSSQTIMLAGGQLSGGGTVAGNFANTAGNVKPGDGVGALTINGTYQQLNAGVLEIELGGTAAITQYDRLVISGSASLLGEVRVSLANGFTPSVGQQFTILTANSLSNAFNSVTGPGQYSLSYVGNTVVLTVTATPCSGDLNGDRVVNLADLAALLSNYGAVNVSYNRGDLDGNGVVDLADLAVLLSSYGVSCP